MLSQLSVEASRQAAFDALREASLEAVATPSVQEYLGECAASLSVELENCFLAPQENGQLVVPPKQFKHNNIAVHLVLNQNERVPNADQYHGRIAYQDYLSIAKHSPAVAAAELDVVRQVDPIDGTSGERKDIVAYTGWRSVTIQDVPTQTGHEQLVFCRPLVVMQGQNPTHANTVADLCFGISRFLAARTAPSAELQGVQPQAVDLRSTWQKASYATMVSRASHKAAMAIYLAGGEIEPDVVDFGVDHFRQTGVRPVKTGAECRKLTASSNQHLRTVAALVLSELFGDKENPHWATPQETAAYLSADLV